MFLEVVLKYWGASGLSGKQAEMRVLRACLQRPEFRSGAGRGARNLHLVTSAVTVCALSVALLMNADSGPGTSHLPWADVKRISCWGHGQKLRFHQ